MKIYTTDSVKVAERVLKLVKKAIKDYPDNPNFLGTYQNGREQGYSLHFFTKHKQVWLAWSLDRNSDNVVVYVDSSDPCQSVSDKAWDNRRLFDSNVRAAKYIVQIIEQAIKA